MTKITSALLRERRKIFLYVGFITTNVYIAVGQYLNATYYFLLSNQKLDYTWAEWMNKLHVHDFFTEMHESAWEQDILCVNTFNTSIKETSTNIKKFV